jgi:lipoyl-dependent peroxiredoxin
MKTRKAIAEWKGDLKTGRGSVTTDSGSLENTPFTFNTRFGQDKGADPEEFVGAALAGCFSMALANKLATDGFKVNRIDTSCSVDLSKNDAGFEITRFQLNCEGNIDGISEEKFKLYADNTRKNCIIAKALSAVKIDLAAKMVKA